jgi:tetratricopeptide (TPR) repeat protein
MKFPPKSIFLLVLLIISGCSSARQHTEAPGQQTPGQQEAVSEKEQLQSTALLINASKQKILGNYEQAVALYNEAIQKDPNNDAAYFELAKLFLMNGNYEEGLEYAGNAAKIDPDNVFYQVLLADIFILQENISEALKIFEQLAHQEPDNVDFQEKLLSAYLYEENYEQAIRMINHIETLSGFSEEKSRQKLQIYVQLEWFDEAIIEAERMLKHFPEETIFYEFLGDLYMETGQTEKAREIYLRLLDQDPDSYMARLLLADYYLDQKDVEKAYTYLLEAFNHPMLDIDAKVRIIFTLMFFAEEGQGDHFMEKAVELSQLLLDAHPDEAEVYLVYGDILNQNEQWEEARDIYLEGARRNPSNLSVWQQLLSLSLRLGDYESMREHSELSLEYFFEQPVLFLFNGLANMQLDDYEAAASSLEYGLSITFDDDELKLEFITMLGDVYHFLEAYEYSDQYYEQAIEMDPENATALNNYSYHLAIRNERLDDALRMSEQANNLNPGNAAFQDTYGWIKYQMGDFSEAEKWIKKAIDNSEEVGAAVLEHYGDVMYQLGKKDKALEYWQKAQEAGNGTEFLHKKIEDQTLYE